MTEYTKKDYQRTDDFRNSVTQYLQMEGGEWTMMPPDYLTFSREVQTKKLEEVRDAILYVNSDVSKAEVEAAYEQSQYFLDSTFDFYEGKKDLGRRIRRAFVVPMRSDRTDEGERQTGYASESIPLYPLLDPVKFGVSSEIRMRAIYGLPPAILDTYLKSDSENETGVLVLCPLYADMPRDIWTDAENYDQVVRLSKVVDTVLEKTVDFVHHRLGVDFIGLGATLPHPTQTDFGRKLKRIPGTENLVTTTGHAGTVHMIGKTTLEAMNRSSVESNGTIGVIGAAGSIGWSSVMALRKILPDHTITVYDKRRDKLIDNLRANTDIGRINLADNVGEVFRDNNYIVSAITEKLHLTEEDQATGDIKVAEEFRGVDFGNIKVIDDSQPGAVDRPEIESLGGQVFWVAGKDGSQSKFVTKDGYYTDGVPYDYGKSSGLYGVNTEFACGFEVAVVAANGDKQKAVGKPVEYEKHVKPIGELFDDQYGVAVADFQSFGRPVAIS